jgi:hypothetical protein
MFNDMNDLEYFGVANKFYKLILFYHNVCTEEDYKSEDGSEFIQKVGNGYMVGIYPHWTSYTLNSKSKIDVFEKYKNKLESFMKNKELRLDLSECKTCEDLDETVGFLIADLNEAFNYMSDVLDNEEFYLELEN